MKIVCTAVLICALIGTGAAWAITGAAAKFHAIAAGAYPPGSRIPITMTELNAWLAAEVPTLIGPGVRNVRIETASGNIVTGRADIDFLKIRQAQGEKPGWLLSQLLEGERPVSITARLTSANGTARVDVLRAAISDFVAEGATLDFLVNTFVIPSFPDVKIGKEFALDYKIDRIEIMPGQAVVVLRG